MGTHLAPFRITRPRRDERRRRLRRRRRAPRRRRARRRRRHAPSLGLPRRRAPAPTAAAARPRISTTRAAPPTRSASRTSRSTAASSSRETVVEPFVEAYLAGETPSPCAACNRGVKIAELFALADRLGAARVATGHYARLGRTDDGAPVPPRGRRRRRRTRATSSTRRRASELERLMFPLGESTKAEVRAEAVARKLPGATKGESQELCFVGAGAGALRRVRRGARARAALRPGPIVDADGRVVGAARGRPSLHDRPAQGPRRRARQARVRHVDRRRDRDRAPRRRRRRSRRPTARARRHRRSRPASSLPLDARVRVRYRHEGAPGRVERSTDGSRDGHDRASTRPVRAVSRGQIAVFYDGDRVLGGGRIC